MVLIVTRDCCNTLYDSLRITLYGLCFNLLLQYAYILTILGINHRTCQSISIIRFRRPQNIAGMITSMYNFWSCKLHRHGTWVLTGEEYSTVPLQRGQFSPKSSQNAPHSSPVRARYGAPFVCSNFELYLAALNTVIYAISCYIITCYNDSRRNLSKNVLR